MGATKVLAPRKAIAKPIHRKKRGSKSGTSRAAHEVIPDLCISTGMPRSTPRRKPLNDKALTQLSAIGLESSPVLQLATPEEGAEYPLSALPGHPRGSSKQPTEGVRTQPDLTTITVRSTGTSAAASELRRLPRLRTPSSPGRVCVPHHHEALPGPPLLKDASHFDFFRTQQHTAGAKPSNLGFYSAADLEKYINAIPRQAPRRKRRAVQRQVCWSDELEW